MFISPSVFSPSCAVWASLFPSLRLCATLSIIAIGQLLSKHCNLAAGCYSARTSNIPNLLMSGTRLPVVSAPAACPLWLLRLPAFIPYAKVKKLILTHYILFIWKDRCMFFSDDSPQWRCQQRLPDGSPHWHFRPQLLPDAAASSLVEHLPPSGNLFRTDFRRSAPASNSSATAPRPATNLIRRRRVLRFG